MRIVPTVNRIKIFRWRFSYAFYKWKRKAAHSGAVDVFHVTTLFVLARSTFLIRRNVCFIVILSKSLSTCAFSLITSLLTSRLKKKAKDIALLCSAAYFFLTDSTRNVRKKCNYRHARKRVSRLLCIASGSIIAAIDNKDPGNGCFSALIFSVRGLNRRGAFRAVLCRIFFVSRPVTVANRRVQQPNVHRFLGQQWSPIGGGTAFESEDFSSPVPWSHR